MSGAARALARFIFGHESISRRLEQSSLVQAVAQRLRIREWINAALARHPLQRCLPDSGVKYQIETFEALAVERMYFGNPVYTEILTPDPPATFIDLGCNSGIFPCFLGHLAKGHKLAGLCVDANAAQVELAQKNGRLNAWRDIHFCHGLAGSRTPEAGNAEFFLYPTSLGSSQFAHARSESGRTHALKRVLVPTLKISDLWTDLFGPLARCGCLKIDIEGSEMNFLRAEAPFLSRVDSILLEWHGWATTRDEVVSFLANQNFTLARTVEETRTHGVLFFEGIHEQEKKGLAAQTERPFFSS